MVRQERFGDVAILGINAPPVNALGAAVRLALRAALAELRADNSVVALVIRGEGRMFSAGADITEFGKTTDAPPLSEVIGAIEGFGRPVVAALHGAVLGGGLELAMGAHGRVALAGASLGLPEVALGLLPGAGGTQRLPRLVGAAAALRMILTGQPVTAAEAQALGLVDLVVEDGLTEAAVAFAADLARTGPPQPTRDRPVLPQDSAAFAADLAAAQAIDGPPPLARDRILSCVAAARDLPFDEGLRQERAAFVDLMASPESAALRAAFRERRRQAREAAQPGGS